MSSSGDLEDIDLLKLGPDLFSRGDDYMASSLVCNIRIEPNLFISLEFVLLVVCINFFERGVFNKSSEFS